MSNKNLDEAIKKAVGNLGVNVDNFVIEHPSDENHGDWATNVAMVAVKKLENSKTQKLKTIRSPRELAEKIVVELKKDRKLGEMIDLSRIEVAGAGFINFWLKSDSLTKELEKIVVEKENYGRGNWLVDKKVMVEFTDPNPFKEFHIGHLMSNSVGESLARLLEFGGAKLKRACYQGDVGMHVAKSIWGFEKKLEKDRLTFEELAAKNLQERIHYLGQGYAFGATAYEEEESTKKEMNDLNKTIYEKSDERINRIYEAGRQWSLDYFETIYQKLGTKFDYYLFESEAGEKGKKLVEEYLDKQVFEKSDGAVVFKGEKYGLHTRVFLNSLGLPTYEAKELGLAGEKFKKYPYDWSVVVTGNEIDEYFKVLLKVMSLIYPELAEKTTHIGHGMLRLKTGKMSSRTGKVVTGESLIDDVLGKVKERTKEGVSVSDKTNETIAVGAIKYSILKQSPGKDIIFDFETSLSFEGDSGPYLQYTAARSGSVLRKASAIADESANNLAGEEIVVARSLCRFGEVAETAGRLLQPNLVASYLIDLARSFNMFYNKEQIIGSERESQRLLLTRAVNQVLKNGLGLLGIEVVEKM